MRLFYPSMGGRQSLFTQELLQFSSQHAKSDWMEMEKQRGISITTSVMQFPYHDCLVNLLDTPGHEDFSEDTYRTLTAVDCCLICVLAGATALNGTGGLDGLSEQQHLLGDGGFTGIRVRDNGKSAAFGHLLQIRRQRHNQIFLYKRDSRPAPGCR